MEIFTAGCGGKYATKGENVFFAGKVIFGIKSAFFDKSALFICICQKKCVSLHAKLNNTFEKHIFTT